MRAVLEFQLPEEQEQLEEAANGARWRCVVQEMDQRLRGVVKHGDDEADSEAALFWRQELCDIMGYHNLSMYD